MTNFAARLVTWAIAAAAVVSQDSGSTSLSRRGAIFEPADHLFGRVVDTAPEVGQRIFGLRVHPLDQPDRAVFLHTRRPTVLAFGSFT